MRGIRRLLRPLVRLLIANGITFPVLADLLRMLYVDVAIQDLGGPATATDSRISVVTGVHRKEIRRLRLLDRAAEESPQAVTLSGQIIARWLAAPPWADPPGRPVRLLRSARHGEPSFDALVESVTRDVRPRAVLEEWLSRGLVTSHGERLQLNARAFVPPPGQAEQMFYFGRNLHDHIAAAAANVSATGAAPHVDRSVHYDRLSAVAVDRLEKLARAAAERMLVSFNSKAMAEADKPGSTLARGRRINFGVYIYTDDDSADGA